MPETISGKRMLRRRARHAMRSVGDGYRKVSRKVPPGALIGLAPFLLLCVGVATLVRHESGDPNFGLTLCGLSLIGFVWFGKLWRDWAMEKRPHHRSRSKKVNS